uniref:Uncharacterized protein LOC114337836 n=1 Tax=Diabrotica virgifera virgifera TaxID=50390 RepID=A0A6P7GK67_DIAVI
MCKAVLPYFSKHVAFFFRSVGNFLTNMPSRKLNQDEANKAVVMLQNDALQVAVDNIFNVLESVISRFLNTGNVVRESISRQDEQYVILTAQRKPFFTALLLRHNTNYRRHNINEMYRGNIFVNNLRCNKSTGKEGSIFAENEFLVFSVSQQSSLPFYKSIIDYECVMAKKVLSCCTYRLMPSM